MFQVMKHIQAKLSENYFIFYLMGNVHEHQFTRIRTCENAIHSRQHLERPQTQFYIYELYDMDIDCRVYFSLDEI